MVPILGALLLISVTACTSRRNFNFNDIPPEKAELLDGINSYQSQQQFQASLAAKGLRADVDNTRASFVIATVRGYSHLGCTGHVEASFVFDRLMAITFVPSDENTYRSALLRTGIRLVHDEDETLIGKYTKLKTFRNAHGARSYSWIDTRLEEGWNNWAEDHAG
jgi:hypothetical protein